MRPPILLCFAFSRRLPTERFQCVLHVNLSVRDKSPKNKNWLGARLRGLVGAVLAFRVHFWLVWGWAGVHVGLLAVGNTCLCCGGFVVLVRLVFRVCVSGRLRAGLGWRVAWVGSGAGLLFVAPL